MDVIFDFSRCSERCLGLEKGHSAIRAEHKNDVGRAATGQRAQFTTDRLSSIDEHDGSECSGGHVVTMVEATESPHSQNLAGHIRARRCHLTRKHSLLQREVHPVLGSSGCLV
jgi:hypothetical protein